MLAVSLFQVLGNSENLRVFEIMLVSSTFCLQSRHNFVAWKICLGRGESSFDRAALPTSASAFLFLEAGVCGRGVKCCGMAIAACRVLHT